VISFNQLGRLGRLGNQMFQYAALAGVARRMGYELSIPRPRLKKPWKSQLLYEAFPALRDRSTGLNQDAPELQEAHFHFDPRIAFTCPDGVDLVGFFQSERYFADAEAEVRRAFAFAEGTVEACRPAIEAVGAGAISLHVRRKDYLRLSEIHPPLDIDYYQRALASLPSDAPVMVFSDAPKWCRAQALFRADRFVFSEGRTGVEDMCLMSMCRRHIIANSSFSWWGAWLNPDPDKTVIAPARWFGTSGYTSGHDTRDLIPEPWIRI
jgi:hypothetical protein